MIKENNSQAKQLNKEFNTFKGKVMSSKHSHWFDCLSNERKFKCFLKQKHKKFIMKSKNKSFSLNKFLFNTRKEKYFSVNKNILRDKAINKILK